MYSVIDLDKLKGFEWDKANIDKSYKKHGITPNQAEEIFLDENVILVEDIKHSQKEKRFIAIGKTTGKKNLFIVFTIRNKKIRIISARKANRKERKQYEKTTKENSIL